jgi:hypothetical protein
LEGGCDERSGDGDGDAVSSVFSRMKVEAGCGLWIESISGAAVESDGRRRLLALLAFTE